MPRVVNGVRTHAYPEVGAFLWAAGDRLDTSCSGTLVGCRTVVTAAHCFCGSDISGAACERSGVLDAERRAQVFALQHAGIFSLQSVRIHPDYIFPQGGDLAVVELGEPVEGIRPAVINDVQRPPAGSRPRIVGFGVTDGSEYDAGIKRTGLVTLGTCRGIAPQDTHLCWVFDSKLGAPGEDSNTCFGDSGGPLFADLAGRPRLAGVTSGGSNTFGCVDDRSFDTDVFVYRDWIRSEVGDDLGRTCGSVVPIADAGTAVWTAEDTLSVFEDRTDLSFNVPPNTVELRVFLNGADASPGFPQPNTFTLAVRRALRPSLDNFECADTTPGPFGFCSFANPTPGTWHASAFWVEGFGTVQLTASVFGQAPTRGPCWGDCNGDGSVQIDELVTSITIGLGGAPLSICVEADTDGGGTVTVDETLATLNAALFGCSASPAGVSS